MLLGPIHLLSPSLTRRVTVLSHQNKAAANQY